MRTLNSAEIHQTAGGEGIQVIVTSLSPTPCELYMANLYTSYLNGQINLQQITQHIFESDFTTHEVQEAFNYLDVVYN